MRLFFSVTILLSSSQIFDWTKFLFVFLSLIKAQIYNFITNFFLLLHVKCQLLRRRNWNWDAI
jgi:hypothetical protein